MGILRGVFNHGIVIADGGSTWLNEAAHQACLARALAILRELARALHLAQE